MTIAIVSWLAAIAYWIMAGVVYALLPKNWKSSYAHVEDNMPRFWASLFWPLTGPFFIGMMLVKYRSQRTVKIPKATARSVR